MTLSGTFGKTIATGYRLQLDWTATQNIANNQSTVTAKLYWMSLGSYYTVNSSMSRESAVQYNDGSFSTESHTPALSGNQKKLVNTYEFTLTHNTDGTKSFSLDGYFDINVNLGGNSYTRVDLDQTTFTLNTIPRESKLNDTTPSFTVGDDITLSITRYSSSFKHEIEFYVGNKVADTWNWIKQIAFTTTQTSKSTSFTSDEIEDIFSELNGASSKDVKATLQTFNSAGDFVGSNDYFGTATAPSASVVTSTTDRSVYIDQEITINIDRKNSGFTHTLLITCGSFSKTITGVGTSVKWTPSDTEQASLYAQTPTAKSVTGNIQVTTKYGAANVRTSTPNSISFHVRNSNPTFGTGYTYADTNPATTGITGDPLKIVQGKSTVTVTLPSTAKANAINGANMTQNGAGYVATLNGIPKTASWSSTGTVTFVFGVINANTNQTLSIKAVDSRGNYTTTTQTVTILPYENPVLITSAKRRNSFENTTTLTLNGNIHTLGGLNSIQGVKYRYKDSKATGAIPTWDTWSPFTYTTSGETYAATNVVLDLDTTKSYNVEFWVTDELGGTPIPVTVPTGQPIMFVDSVKKSVGVGKFPAGTGTFEVNGTIVLPTAKFASSGGGIDLNNSDIIGANSFWFDDTATSSAEAIQFMKSTTPVGSFSASDWDSFRVYDGTGYLNDKVIFTSDNRQLWAGVAAFMQEGQVVTPTKKLSECPNGWIVMWSDAAGTYDWVFSHIPKDFPSFSTGSGARLAVPTAYQTTTTKYLYISDVAITGNAENNDAGSNAAVIRYVYSY